MHVLMNPCVPHDVRSLDPLAWAVGVRCLLLARAHGDSRTLVTCGTALCSIFVQTIPDQDTVCRTRGPSPVA